MASVHGSQSKISNCGGTRESGKQILVEEETSSRWEVGKGKRRKPTSKVIPKKKRQDLMKYLRAVELSTLRIGMRTAVEEQFGDGQFNVDRRSKTRCGVTWFAMLEPNTTISTSQISILVFMNLCSIVDVT